MAFSQQSPDALMPGMLQFCVETKIKIVLLQREVLSASRGGPAHAHAAQWPSSAEVDGAGRWSGTGSVLLVGRSSGRRRTCGGR